MPEIQENYMQELSPVVTEKISPEIVVTTTNPVEETKKVPKTRNRVAKTVTTGKVSSVADSIAKMEEKITLLKYVDSIKVPEVPTGLTKDGRETLLQIGKDVEALKGRMIAAIQKS